jgi:hypothetical protein
MTYRKGLTMKKQSWRALNDVLASLSEEEVFSLLTQEQLKDPEVQREILIDYLQVMIARCDWHGVADVAMDLREMEAERRATT